MAKGYGGVENSSKTVAQEVQQPANNHQPQAEVNVTPPSTNDSRDLGNAGPSQVAGTQSNVVHREGTFVQDEFAFNFNNTSGTSGDQKNELVIKGDSTKTKFMNNFNN